MPLLLVILMALLFAYLSWHNSPSQKGKRGEKRVCEIPLGLLEEYVGFIPSLQSKGYVAR